MKRIVFTTILLFSSLIFFGQNDQLVLKKHKRSKQKIIETTERIKVITKSGLKTKGKFRVIDDKTIAIGIDTILLENIKKIRYKSNFGIISGALIGASGTAGIIGGTGIIISTSSEGVIAAAIGVILGVPVIAVGTLVATTGVLVATVGKAHKAKKWEYHTVKVK